MQHVRQLLVRAFGNQSVWRASSCLDQINLDGPEICIHKRKETKRLKSNN